MTEAAFSFLFASHSCPAWVCDRETLTCLDVNEAAVARYGYVREEFLGRRHADLLLLPEDIPRLAGDLAKDPIQGGQSREWRHRLRNGEVISVDVTFESVTLAGRRAVLVVAQDRAARTRTEQGLRKSQEQYRTVVDNVKQVIFQTDERGRWTFLNAAWTDITGFTVEESLGTRFLRYVHPEDRQRHAELFQPLIDRRDEYFGLEVRYLTKTGSVRWVDAYARLTFDDGGAVTGTFGTLMDVTERKRAEEELRAARARLQHLLVSSPAIIYSSEVGGDYAVTFVSENVTRQLGYEAHEFLDDPGFWTTRLHPEEAPRVVAELSHLAEHGHQRLEYRFRHRDATYRWIHDERRLVRDAAGDPVEIVGSWVDVTERREAEATRAHLEAQLRQAQKLQAIGRLAGGVAHDFNNLLTVIRGRSDLLLRRYADGGPLSRDLELIANTAERAASLTRQLLAFSRKQILAPRILDLNGVLANMSGMLRRLIGEDVDLVTLPDPALGRVRADPGQVEQVIMNLAVNSRDAMPRGGRLEIETANVELDETSARRHGDLRPGAYVMLAVRDAGCGMDAETLSHIFEPFFTTKGPDRGTGLGLATVYGIVKQSDGDIAVESEPDRGTTFRIYLPRVDDDIEALVGEAAGAVSPRGSETVLLVEDEAGVRKLAREILRQSGYTVLAAANGAEALQIAARHAGPIHLLVSDVVMPHMGGRETAQRLLALRPAMRVLYLSGYTDDAILRHGVLASETALLTKPFTAAALSRKVREILDAPEPGTGAAAAPAG